MTEQQPPWWASSGDHELIEMCGLMGFRAAPGGISQPAPDGFRAQAELLRRNTEQLAALRSELQASGKRLEVLTWVLVAVGVLTVIATVIAVIVSATA